LNKSKIGIEERNNYETYELLKQLNDPPTICNDLYRIKIPFYREWFMYSSNGI